MQMVCLSYLNGQKFLHSSHMIIMSRDAESNRIVDLKLNMYAFILIIANKLSW